MGDDSEEDMSTYALSKLLRDVNRIPELRQRYFEDKEAFADGYALSGEEREALLAMDIGKMYHMGVHGLILRPFTLIHQISEPDYLSAIRG